MRRRPRCRRPSTTPAARGADCNSIHENGGRYNPNTVAAHCSWAANSNYQNNKAKGATCDFTGTATLTTSDPSSSGCSYPTSASAVGTMTPTTGGTMGGTPGTFTLGAGTTGTGMRTGTTTGTTGAGLGLGPAGTGMDTTAATLLPSAGVAAILTVLLSAIAFA
ncbi:hypothetical protein SETIT_2G383500v2 [Setaria italica]|uniref:X8 domain-containing protein n=1 Tax=Setaria italica TaxID=4555 RepID=K4A1B8_SETIT|nr:hypothetical protein SETIT_2G383500v2 [Setaria italica]